MDNSWITPILGSFKESKLLYFSLKIYLFIPSTWFFIFSLIFLNLKPVSHFSFDFLHFFCYNRHVKYLSKWIMERWESFNRNFPLFAIETFLLFKNFNQRIEIAPKLTSETLKQKQKLGPTLSSYPIWITFECRIPKLLYKYKK